MKNQKNPNSFVSKLDSWFTELTQKSILQPVNLPCNTDGVEMFVKRDDLIHSFISGNKIRKLKFNIHEALANNCRGIITYGGAYSNHLIASAAAAKELGIEVLGKVRGEELTIHSNSILQQCHEMGMKLEFLPRSQFTAHKHLSGIVEIDGASYWSIPEGGANLQGILGCAEIILELDRAFDYYLVAQGTTTTSLGLLKSIPENAKLIVVPVLKGFDVLKEMRNLLQDENLFETLRSKLIIWDDQHHGGYAKMSQELLSFINEFHHMNDFKIEPVYTGKVFFALNYYLSDDKEMFSNKKGDIFG